ncbi:MAG: hypothetical protein H7A45_10415 [Verrucomicrobiales bacterium]|nr:hypothetical protein [Verrucomicrobiales bacterium]
MSDERSNDGRVPPQRGCCPVFIVPSQDDDVPGSYKTIRQEIHYEHTQINSRMGWFITHQTALIAAAAALMLSELREKQPILALLMTCTIATIATVLAKLIRETVMAAIRKLELLRIQERKHLPKTRPAHEWLRLAIHEVDWREELQNRCEVPLWFCASPEDINRDGACYPMRAPQMVAVLWILIAYLAVLVVGLPLLPAATTVPEPSRGLIPAGMGAVADDWSGRDVG